jgi:hypothetical protein
VVYGVYLINVDLVGCEPCDKACIAYSHKFIHDYDPTMHHVINYINYMKKLTKKIWTDMKVQATLAEKMSAACFWRSTWRNKIVT